MNSRIVFEKDIEDIYNVEITYKQYPRRVFEEKESQRKRNLKIWIHVRKIWKLMRCFQQVEQKHLSLMAVGRLPVQS